MMFCTRSTMIESICKSKYTASRASRPSDRKWICARPRTHSIDSFVCHLFIRSDWKIVCAAFIYVQFIQRAYLSVTRKHHRSNWEISNGIALHICFPFRSHSLVHFLFSVLSSSESAICTHTPIWMGPRRVCVCARVWHENFYYSHPFVQLVKRENKFAADNFRSLAAAFLPIPNRSESNIFICVMTFWWWFFNIFLFCSLRLSPFVRPHHPVQARNAGAFAGAWQREYVRSQFADALSIFQILYFKSDKETTAKNADKHFFFSNRMTFAIESALTHTDTITPSRSQICHFQCNRNGFCDDEMRQQT